MVHNAKHLGFTRKLVVVHRPIVHLSLKLYSVFT